MNLSKNKTLYLVILIILIFGFPIISLLGIGTWLVASGNSDRILDFIDKVRESQESVVKEERVVTSEESTVIDVVEKASDSVVSIAVRQVDLNADSGPMEQDSNIGTGFIIRDDGLIATNQHVVSDTNSEYVVTTKDNQVYEIKNIYRDSVNDIALIRIETNGDTLTPLDLGDSDSLKIGQLVVAIGTPLGDYPGTVTTGVVSGMHRTVSTGGSFWEEVKTYEDVLQTDAAINPGNSGGPLLDSSGDVIGINFATTSGADNISFALPVNLLKTKLEQFDANGGKFVRAYIGVYYEQISDSQAARFNVPAGAFITDLEENGPADQAGIEAGDIITEINGQSVENGLSQVISTFKPGEEVTVKYWRKTGNNYVSGGEYHEVKVTLGEKEE